MSGSGGSQQTTQVSTPWIRAIPHLTGIMNQARDMQASGVGSQLWDGPNVAPLDPAMQQGINMMTGTAQNAAGAAASPFYSAVNSATNGGSSPQQMLPTSIMRGVATGRNGINTGGTYGDLAGLSLTQNQTPNSVLSGVATNANPNADAAGILGNVASGPGINSSGFAGLMDRSLTQNAQPNSVMAGLSGNQIGSINTGDQYRSVANTAAGATASDSLAGMLSGGSVNPHLQAMMDANAERIANRVNSSMSGMGRYGSGSHTDLMARSIAEANNPLLAQAYESDQNRRLSAAGQIDSSRRAADATRLNAISGETGVQGQNIANSLSNAGLQLNAANTLAGGNRADLSGALSALSGGIGVDQQNIANRMGAAAGMAGIRQADTGQQINAANTLAAGNRADLSGALGAVSGMTGVQGQNIANQVGAAGGLLDNYASNQQTAQGWASLLPSLNQLQYDPATRMMGVGGMLGDRAQADLDAERALFEQQQAMPWTQLARYQGAVSGLSPLMAGAGTKTGEASATASWNDLLKFGANAGAMALPMLSDRNEKTDIKKVGKDPDTGLDLYSYRYKGDPKTYPKVVGPMAQDIEKHYPGSTVEVGGKLAVRPEAAGLLGAL